MAMGIPRRTVSAGGVVLNARGQVLVVSQPGNTWSLPKGHLETGEDGLTAARREIYEESGVARLEWLGELGCYDRPRIGLLGEDDHSELKTIHFFLFRALDEQLAPIDPLHKEARWLDPLAAVDQLTHPRDRQFLADVLPRLPTSGQTR